MRSKVFNPQVAQRQAMQLFWQKGYAQTSMDELLKTMGISRSSFYNAFGDKRQLYQDVLKEFATMGNLAVSVLQVNAPIKRRLIQFFELTFEKHGVAAEYGCLLVNTILEQQAHDDQLATMAAGYLKQVEQGVEQALVSSIQTGEMNDKLDTKQMAALIMTLIKGLRVGAREGKSIPELKALFEQSLSLLDSYLVNPEV